MSDAFPRSVCIVDDDTDFVSFLQSYLEARSCKVCSFGSTESFLESRDQAIRSEFFLVDLSLPGADGVDLIGMIRTQSNAGIIVISGRMGPDAFSSALAVGADMFINKPVRFDQVYQAILSVTRRVAPGRNASAGWSFQKASGTLMSPSGAEITLTPTELKLVCKLISAQEAPVPRQTLASVAKIAASKDYRNLDAAMFRLRRKIEQATNEPAPFRTVHGSGYAIIDVTTN